MSHCANLSCKQDKETQLWVPATGLVWGSLLGGRWALGGHGGRDWAGSWPCPRVPVPRALQWTSGSPHLRPVHQLLALIVVDPVKLQEGV